MSEIHKYIFGGVLFIVLVGMTNVASQRVGSADRETVAAATVRHVLTEIIGEDTIQGRGEVTDPLYLCLSSEVDVDVKRIASELASTIIRPIPVKECASNRVEGDFGMFGAMTYYYAPNGEEAGHLTIAELKCATPSECMVDIDMVGWGERYSLKQTGGEWKVSDQRNRWIV